MWKAKDYITIVLVAILVTLLVINTVKLDHSDGARAETEPATGQAHGLSSLRPTANLTRRDTSGSSPPTPRQLGAAHAISWPTGGERESFNSEATGLGDLEGSDEFKKMLRWSSGGGEIAQLEPAKRGRPSKPVASRLSARLRTVSKRQVATRRALLSSGPGFPMRAARHIGGNRVEDVRNRRKISATSRELALAIERMMTQRRRPPRAGPTLQVSRRADLETMPSGGQSEDLLDRLVDDWVESGHQQDDKSNSDNDDGFESKPLIGEFGSRISLLTMRKDPESKLAAGELPLGVRLTNANGQKLTDNYTRHTNVGGATSPMATIQELIKFLSEQNPTNNDNNNNNNVSNESQVGATNPLAGSIMGSDSNNLPRIARAFM